MAKPKESKQAEVNIGLVGHVDAGKTSLVEALTGKWADTHSEELRRGISIRLGYADTSFYVCDEGREKKYCAAPEVGEKTQKKCTLLRKVSFVDAPGHETLMMTMLSGAALMDGAILVIAANETCPQPQTVEHMNAISMTGIKNLVVAQNKIDLVTKEQAKKNHDEIREFLKEYGYENTPLVPTAAHQKANIDLLIKTIEETIPTQKQEPGKPLKMYCARSFDINKPGTKPENMKGGILGGTIIQGKIRKGDKVEISPGPGDQPIVTTVQSISCSSGELSEGLPGGLIAFGTTLDPGLTQNDQMKGQIISKPGTLPNPSNKISMEVNFFKRVLTQAASEIKPNEPLVLIVGTLPVIGSVTESAGNEITVVTKRPVVVEKGQRIALSKRDKNKWRLVAYGVSKAG